MPPRIAWIGALLLTVLIGGYLGFALFGNTPSASPGKQSFLPGKTTHGHYQIELACSACHKPFQGVTQKACLACHGEALKLGEDSHPNKKFADPRNADKLLLLDATRCVTCHREHKPELIHAMDVTLPDDFCFECHQDVSKERPSHKEFDFKSCASGGCHNYHDNKALYEDFLAAHMHEPDTLQPALVPLRTERIREPGEPVKPLVEADQNAPADVLVEPSLLKDWAGTAHARSGVNCKDCHQAKNAKGQGGPWRNRLDHKACMECHKDETKGFLAGTHGMRLAQGLGPMTPDMARLPMKVEAHDKSVGSRFGHAQRGPRGESQGWSEHKALGCASCHDAHAFNTRRAAVESCLDCHDDEHSRAYQQSAHFRLWQAEAEGRGDKGSGVSCATCHLPRTVHKRQDLVEVRVEHNQDLNLRPNEKMIRGVCMQCHGLGFSIDALADPNLVRRNFSGKPAVHIKSIEMAELRQRLKPKKKDPLKQKETAP